MKRLQRIALAWAVTAAVFLALDASWLGAMSARLYQPALAHLLAPHPDAGSAVLFYVLYISGMVVFTVRPGAAREPRGITAARAAFFGVVAYGTYDLTNQATLPGWPASLSAIDLLWGATATALATLAAREAVRLALEKDGR